MEERMSALWSCGTPEVRGSRAWGEICLKLEGIEPAGRCFYTEPIRTGLGPGLFCLTFALADADGYDGGLLPAERLLFGDPGVFAQSSYVPGIPAVRLGAYAEPSEGTFRLGVMLLDRAVRCRLRIRWWAEKTEAEPAVKAPAEGVNEFYISNAPKSLKTGQKYQLSCVRPEGAQKVRWEVLTEGGGEITSYGMYTAPTERGIYQVQAVLEKTQQTASVYLMVR